MQENRVRISEIIGGRLDPSQFHWERIEAIRSLNKYHKTLKLHEVAKSVKTTTTEITDSDIYIGLENIVSNTGEYVATNEKTSISSAAIFKKGNILFPKLRPYLNKVHFAQLDGKCSTEFYVFEATKIDPQFLAIYLRSDLIVNQTKHLMTGNTLPRLQTDDVMHLLIPDISLDIQNTIACLYNSAYSQKQSKEKEVQRILDNIDDYLLKELGATTIQKKEKSSLIKISNILGSRLDAIYYCSDISKFIEHNESITLKNVCLEFKSGIGAGKADQANENEGLLQIRPTNINNRGLLIFEKNIYVPKGERLVYLQKGDVIFNNTNSQELVGKTAILETEDELTFSNHITRIRVDQTKILPQYLWIILNLYQKHKIFYAICTNWNNQSGIGIELLKSLEIPIFSLERQKTIVHHVKSLREKASQLEKEALSIFTEATKQVENMIIN